MRNMEDDGHLLLCTLLFPAWLMKKLVQMSAMLHFWEYKGCERCRGIALFVYNSSLTCWIWGWDYRSVSCGMLLAPRELLKAGDVLGTSCPERSSHQKGPDGVSSGCSQLITCFCFHLCSPVGDWGLLLSNNCRLLPGKRHLYSHGDTDLSSCPGSHSGENEGDVVCLLCVYAQECTRDQTRFLVVCLCCWISSCAVDMQALP